MTDYWNDPPDDYELPECCGVEMDVNESTGVATCATCQKCIEPEPEIEPIDFTDDVDIGNICETCGIETEPCCVYCSVECQPPCIHGNKGECATCDYLSDLAYDAMRESR